MLIVKSKLAKHLLKLRNFVEIHLIFEKCNLEQIYLLPKQNQNKKTIILYRKVRNDIKMI